MVILAGFILAFLVLRTLVSLVNLLSGLHLPEKKPRDFPKVSILIPARNEEIVIGQLLSGLQQLDYPDFEVIVCNDHSSDNTEEIIDFYASEDFRIQVFLSEKLPDDWLGKNFACYQLAKKATGNYLVFIDADVVLSKNAITKAVSFAQKKKLSFLSIFPQQIMLTFAERITVPVINWFLLSHIALIFMQKKWFFSALAAADGQFMMFEATSYRKHQWHSKVRNENVEDIHIARMVTTSGLKMAVLLANKDVFCRMYHHFDEAILGFSRNVHEYFVGFRTLMLFFWLMICLGPWVVLATFGPDFFYLYAIMVVCNRLFVSIASRQNAFLSVMLHPLQMISLSLIIIKNMYRMLKKETIWKGRKIKF